MTTHTNRNVAVGHIAAHTFTTPGTYTITHTARDGNSSASETIQITANSNVAPIEWDGSRTILVSTSGTFTNPQVSGTPTQHTFTNWATLITAIQGIIDTAGTYKGACRIALRKGETFTGVTVNGGQYIRSTAGPGILCTYDDNGFYPTDANAIIASSVGSASGGLLNFGGTGSTYLGMDEWKVVGLDIDCSATPTTSSVSAIATLANVDALCIHKVNFIGVNFLCISLSKNILDSGTFAYSLWDEFSVTSCSQLSPRTDAAAQLNTFFFGSFKRGYIDDNFVQPNDIAYDASHGIRVEHCRGLVVTNNHILTPSTNSHALKVHSDEVIERANSTAYLSTRHGGQGDYRRPAASVAGGYNLADTQPPVFRCTTSGTSAGSAPAFDTVVGNTTTDGTCVWTCVDYATINPSEDKTWDTTANPRTGQAWGYWSHDVVISSNYIEGGVSAVPLALGALDTDDWSRVERFVIEDNFLNSDVVGTAQQAAIWCFTKYGVIRNNAINYSESTNTPQAIYLGLRAYTGPGSESSCWAAEDVHVYNNSLYIDATASSALDGFRLDVYAKSIVIKNNLLYAPGLGAKTITVVQGTGHATYPVVASNNTGNTGTPTTDPKFSGVLTTVPVSGWQITDGTSYTKNAGTSVQNWKDLFGNTRTTGSMDIGASEQ